jgi:predicted membrane channel-forming protein YqfA (hemolysin III family)
MLQAELYKKTLNKSQVPAYFHVPYVETGYRYLHLPWRFYMYSIFYNNMETLNVWTHVLGTLVMTSRLYQISFTFDLLDPFTWPLLAAVLSFTAMFLTSSAAHMFSHKSMDVNCCMFMADFACTGLYGYGTILTHYYYSLDQYFLDSVLLRNVFYFGSILAVLSCAFGSMSKAIVHDLHSRRRTALIISGLGLIYILSNFPILHRMWNSEWTEGIAHHLKQMVCMLGVCFFYSTKIPERLSPGTFDFIGNSHQIFHILLVLSTQSHVDGVVWDIKFRQAFVVPRPPPSLWNTFGIIALICVADILTAKYFYSTFKKKVKSN